MAERSDAQWLEELRSEGRVQEAALDDLRAVLQRAALFYARRRLGGSEGVGGDEVAALAEDSAQEASLIVLAKMETFRGEAKFLTWASSLAVRVTMTALRRRL